MEKKYGLSEIQICTRCILPATFPGIDFDEEGVCKYCRRKKAADKSNGRTRRDYRNQLDALVESVRGKAPSYDVVMAYSGGKDSSYTLKLLKERYDLRILAMTFDNHFMSETAWINIKTITDVLSIDLVSFRLPWPVAQKLFNVTARQDIFAPATLLRASSVCTACIGLVKSLVLKAALEMAVPLVAFGWSPGQAPIQSALMKTNPLLVAKNQETFKKSLQPHFNGFLDRYFIPQRHFQTYKDSFPHNIHPLAFFEYDEEAIKTELQQIGWRAPADTDTNSSNCLLNAYANDCHLKRHGFHPYVWEIANMVRDDVMTRDEGLDKIYSEQDSTIIETAKQRLSHE